MQQVRQQGMELVSLGSDWGSRSYQLSDLDLVN